jgi:hypothetical protein
VAGAVIGPAAHRAERFGKRFHASYLASSDGRGNRPVVPRQWLTKH